MTRETEMGTPRNDDDRPLADRRHERARRRAEESGEVAVGPEDYDEPDFAGENTPSATDPPNAEPDDHAPDERWEKPTEV
jgi:hypothetical protein